MALRNLALLLLFALASVAAPPAFGSVAGKTIKYKNSQGQTYWTTYHKNGTSSSKSTKRGGGCCVYDTGHWRYNAKGELCESYDRWRGGDEFCRSTSNPRAVYSTRLSSSPRYSIKSNEEISLFGVYWIAHCKSILKSFAGIDKLEGPSDISLSLKPGKVYARRQGCPKPVRGATVFIKAGKIKSHTQAKLVFRVRYNTKHGRKQSTHTVTIGMYP